MANQLNKQGINTGITWCDATINLWWGCTKVHTGCDNCYAEKLSKRFGNNIWGNYNARKEITSVWRELNKIQKEAQKNQQIKRVFIGSMMDIFEKTMPLTSVNGSAYNTGFLRDRLFSLISIGRYPNIQFLLLTKRPSNINKYIPENWKTDPPENVMFGTSVSNQHTAKTLIPQLLQVNGKRFLSVEPQINEIVFDKSLLIGINWIIQGGESGSHKRPFKLDWAIKMRNQCAEANILYFFKQIDGKQPIPEELKIMEFPKF